MSTISSGTRMDMPTSPASEVSSTSPALLQMRKSTSVIWDATPASARSASSCVVSVSPLFTRYVTDSWAIRLARSRISPRFSDTV